VLSAVVLLEVMPPALSQVKKKGITPYLNKLTNWFNASDLNGDGYLDKDELAKAFRGPGAKAYDHKDPDKDKDKDDPASSLKAKVRPISIALVCLPEPGLAPNLAIAELLTQPAEKQAKKKGTNYNNLPDYRFLVQLDTDGDKKISRPEFNAWARDYAGQLKAQDDLNKSIQKTQAQLAKASAKNRAQLQRALQQEQRDLSRLMQKMDKALAKAFAGLP
jgi:hypothetical protein